MTFRKIVAESWKLLWVALMFIILYHSIVAEASTFRPLDVHPEFHDLQVNELLPHLNVVRDVIEQKPVSVEEASSLTRQGVLSLFYDAMCSRVWGVKEFIENASLMESFTVLSLEFLSSLDLAYGVIPLNAKDFKSTRSPKTTAERAKISYANFTRAWFHKSRLSEADYPLEFFKALRQAGLGDEYPDPKEDTPPEFYAMRLVHIVVYEKDRALVRNWLDSLIPAFLDLAGYTKTVAPSSADAGRILRMHYLLKDATADKE